MNEPARKLPRVASPRVFPAATRASKPPIDAAGSADAYRQTGFVLGTTLDLLLRGFAIEGSAAQASSGAKYRSQAAAAAMGLWSRSFLARLEAMHAVEWGNYVAAIALVRAAADYRAGGLYVLRDRATEWETFLAEDGIALEPGAHAMAYRLHAFRAAEVLAEHAILGPIYRASMDLSLPHFGATLLVSGNDSTPERVLMTFADRDFHLGLAELVTGWLALLSVAQLEAAVEFEGVFARPDAAAIAAWGVEARALVGAPGRCRVERIEHDGEQRYLITNWRRQPGGAAKRVLL